MKITKHFSLKSQKQIWRIIISDTDKLIFETRDTNTKETFYCCHNVTTQENIFSDIQLDEKYYLGIEAVYKDIIFFHKFPKPDLPGHKQIIAFDIASQKILWTNVDLSFFFIDDNLVYGFQQGFEERYFFALDYLSGELVKEFGDDYKTINALRNKAENEKDWSNYLYPQIFKHGSNEKIDHAINSQINKLDIAGNVEYNVYNYLLLFNFHSKVFEGNMANKFIAFDLKTDKILLTEVLNANTTALFTDSFFVYKNLLFLLREKNEVLIYKIE